MIPRPYSPYLQLRLLSLIHSLTKRALLDHYRHDLVQGVGGSHGRVLSIRVVCRSNLDDVSSNKVDTIEAAQYGPELARRPPSSLRGARGWGDCIPRASALPASHRFLGGMESKLTCGIQGIDINTQVHGVCGADSLPYRISVTCCSQEGLQQGTA